jgi:putative flippase GtrA
MTNRFTRAASRLPRFARFAVVGSAGFLIDSSVLWLGTHEAGLGLYLGRIISFCTSATITWYLNRAITYSDRVSNGRRSDQWLLYLGVSVAGAAVNYGVYCACVATIDVATRFPTLGVAIGSVAGMVVNFTAYSKFVFRAPPPLHAPAPAPLKANGGSQR